MSELVCYLAISHSLPSSGTVLGSIGVYNIKKFYGYHDEANVGVITVTVARSRVTVFCGARNMLSYVHSISRFLV